MYVQGWTHGVAFALDSLIHTLVGKTLGALRLPHCRIFPVLGLAILRPEQRGDTMLNAGSFASL